MPGKSARPQLTWWRKGGGAGCLLHLAIAAVAAVIAALAGRLLPAVAGGDATCR